MNVATAIRCALLCSTCVCWTSSSGGALFVFSGLSSDGHAVSATADFTLNPGADMVSVKLTNTTATTLDSGELFTGLDFSFGGLAPAMTSDMGIERTVDGAGAFTDTGSPQNISWSLASLGSGVHQLNFNPNAADGIIGPPTMGSYAGANGSIKGNAGHNPFTAEKGLFELSVPGLEASTPVNLSMFRFGTTLTLATGTIVRIPEPATGALTAAGLGIAVLVWRGRRR